MQIKIKTAGLLSVLSHVATVIPRRTPKPILQCVRLEAQYGTLTALGTDSEISVVGTADTDTERQSGVVVVQADRLLAVIREIPGEFVDLEANDGKLAIRSGGSQFTLATEPADVFPTPETGIEGPTASVPATGLRDALRRTVIAVDDVSTRYALGGVQLTLQESSATLAATDSRRLSVVDIEAAYSGDLPMPQVVPIKAVNALVSILGKLGDSASVTVYLDAREAVFRAGDYLVRTRLVECRFPAWEKVIPTERQTSLTVDAGDFASCVRQVGLMADTDDVGARFYFGEEIRLECSTGRGESHIEMAPESISGPGVEVTLNPRLILDAVKVADDKIEIEIVDKDSAVLMRIGEGWRYVVMPLSRSQGG